MTFCFSVQYFNSRPHEEVDITACPGFNPTIISTHDLTKRSTAWAVKAVRTAIFQLTTSRRGRPPPQHYYIKKYWISTHDLTKRSTQSSLTSLTNPTTFQLTTSRRGRLLTDAPYRKVRYFNSRPHEEVDWYAWSISLQSVISTHDLTKRSTSPTNSDSCNIRHFNSRPHEEVDPRRYVFLACAPPYFNSRPHEEVDLQPQLKSFPLVISTHDLTKRSTI